MNKKVGKGLIGMVLAITLIGFAGFAAAQDKAADNMELVKEKIRADKKLFIATNMQLTESEVKAFDPVYEAYQAELNKLRDREIKLIEKFAVNYETMSDDAAKSLLEDSPVHRFRPPEAAPILFIKDPWGSVGQKSGALLPVGEQNRCCLGIRDGKKNTSCRVM